MKKVIEMLIKYLFHPLIKYVLLPVLVAIIWYKIAGLGGAVVAVLVPLLLRFALELGSGLVE